MKNILNFVSVGASLAVFLIVVLSFFPFFFEVLSWVRDIFVMNISWFYVLVIFCLFCFCLYLVFSPYGRVRLGGLTAPRYSWWTWLAMLFSAGMGTGLIFSGVYEPLHHYLLPPTGQGGTSSSQDLAFQLTFLHWGFSGWVVYTCVGLAVAYFCFQKNLPFRVSSMMEPFLGEKTKGPIGGLIDILSIVAILFGVATTLGRGALQINSGLSYLFDFSFSGGMQAWIIAGVTAVAVWSVLSGLDKGIRRLSELNIILCFLLLLFVLFSGPTVWILNSFIEYSGMYLQNLVRDMTKIESLGSSQWRSQWTILYWAWWIAWSPFVGLFIAKISEGRTIRELIVGSLMAPVLFSCFWFTVFGGTAVEGHAQGVMDLKSVLQNEYSLLSYKFLEYFPLVKLTAFATLVSVSLFFITSSDSASYVIHHLSSQSASKANKVYWAVMEGLIACLLIFSGGIKSLELLVIATAFPFTVFVCFITYGFFKELRKTSPSR